MMTDTKNRDSNFELLRIICIALIVAYHFVGGIEDFITYPSSTTLNLISFYSMGLWGQTAVLCFVMITGYFTINSKFKLNKILLIIIETEFYSTTIFLIMAYANIIDINYETLTHALFPLLFVDYWFITDYIILLFLSPILNKIIKSLSLEELQYLIIIFIICAYYCSDVTNISEYMNPILFFILFYIIAAYIRLYPNKLTESKKLSTVTLLLCIISGTAIITITNLMYHWTARPLVTIEDNPWPLILLIISVLTIIIIMLKPHKKRNLIIASIVFSFLATFAYMPSYGLGIRAIVEDKNSVIVGISAISLFLTFKNIKIEYNRIINWLAGGVLGVYMIHSNKFLTQYYWQHLVSSDILQDNFFIIEYLSIVILIVAICILIDRVRISLFTIIGNNKYIIKLKNIVIDKMNFKI